MQLWDVANLWFFVREIYGENGEIRLLFACIGLFEIFDGSQMIKMIYILGFFRVCMQTGTLIFIKRAFKGFQAKTTFVFRLKEKEKTKKIFDREKEKKEA